MFKNNLKRAENLIISELFKKGVKKKELNIYSFGLSMAPLFRSNNTLILKPATNIRLGDIVCYFIENVIVFHRVVQVKNTVIVTKGDNNLNFDKPVLKSQIIGKVSFAVGNNRSVVNFILALHSSIQGRIYSTLAKNFLAQSLYLVMSKLFKIKTFHLTLIYKNLSKIIIYPIYLFYKSNIVKTDIKEEAYHGHNWINAVRLYAEMVEDGLYKNEEKLVDRYLKKRGRVLVLGCAAGREAIALSKRGFSITAVDFAENMLNEARRMAKKANQRIKFIKADVEHIPFKENSFDYITLLRVLAHLQKESRIQTLKECRRVLKKNGLMLFSTNPTLIKPSIKDLIITSSSDFKRNMLKKFMGKKYKGIEQGDFFFNSQEYPGPILCHSFRTKETLEEISKSNFKLMAKQSDFKYYPKKKLHNVFYIVKKQEIN